MLVAPPGRVCTDVVPGAAVSGGGDGGVVRAADGSVTSAPSGEVATWAVADRPDVEETVIAWSPLAGMAPQAGSEEASGTTAATAISATITRKTAATTVRSDLSIDS